MMDFMDPVTDICEKIIKTDEILHLFINTRKELRSVTRKYNKLSTKHDAKVKEANDLKQVCEETQKRLLSNLDEHNAIKKENNALRKKNEELEKNLKETKNKVSELPNTTDVTRLKEIEKQLLKRNFELTLLLNEYENDSKNNQEKCKKLENMLSDIIKKDENKKQTKTIDIQTPNIIIKPFIDQSFLKSVLEKNLKRKSKLHCKYSNVKKYRRKLVAYKIFKRRLKILKSIIVKSKKLRSIVRNKFVKGVKQEFKKSLNLLTHKTVLVKKRNGKKKPKILKRLNNFHFDNLLDSLLDEMMFLEKSIQKVKFNKLEIKKEEFSNPNSLKNVFDKDFMKLEELPLTFDADVKDVNIYDTVAEDQFILDIFKDVKSNFDMLSPMSVATSNFIIPGNPLASTSSDIAVGPEEVIPTFSEVFTQTDNNTNCINISVGPDQIIPKLSETSTQTEISEVFMTTDQIPKLSETSTQTEISEVFVRTDQIIPKLSDSSIQTEISEIFVRTNQIIPKLSDSSIQTEISEIFVRTDQIIPKLSDSSIQTEISEIFVRTDQIIPKLSDSSIQTEISEIFVRPDKIISTVCDSSVQTVVIHKQVKNKKISTEKIKTISVLTQTEEQTEISELNIEKNSVSICQSNSGVFNVSDINAKPKRSKMFIHNKVTKRYKKNNISSMHTNCNRYISVLEMRLYSLTKMCKTLGNKMEKLLKKKNDVQIVLNESSNYEYVIKKKPKFCKKVNQKKSVVKRLKDLKEKKKITKVDSSSESEIESNISSTDNESVTDSEMNSNNNQNCKNMKPSTKSSNTVKINSSRKRMFSNDSEINFRDESDCKKRVISNVKISNENNICENESDLNIPKSTNSDINVEDKNVTSNQDSPNIINNEQKLLTPKLIIPENNTNESNNNSNGGINSTIILENTFNQFQQKLLSLFYKNQNETITNNTMENNLMNSLFDCSEYLPISPVSIETSELTIDENITIKNNNKDGENDLFGSDQNIMRKNSNKVRETNLLGSDKNIMKKNNNRDIETDLFGSDSSSDESIQEEINKINKTVVDKTCNENKQIHNEIMTRNKARSNEANVSPLDSNKINKNVLGGNKNPLDNNQLAFERRNSLRSHIKIASIETLYNAPKKRVLNKKSTNTLNVISDDMGSSNINTSQKRIAHTPKDNVQPKVNMKTEIVNSKSIFSSEAIETRKKAALILNTKPVGSEVKKTFKKPIRKYCNNTSIEISENKTCDSNSIIKLDTSSNKISLVSEVSTADENLTAKSSSDEGVNPSKKSDKISLNSEVRVEDENLTTKPSSNEGINQNKKSNGFTSKKINNTIKASGEIRKFLDEEWSNDQFEEIGNKLSSMKASKLAHSIITALINKNSIDLDSSFTPLSPPLTKNEQKIIALIHHMKSMNNLNDIEDFIFSQLKGRILSQSVQVNVLTSLTRVFVVLCRLKYDMETVRLLCCNALYKIGDFVIPLVFTVLTTWPEVLPFKEENNDNMLIEVLVFVLKTKNNKLPEYRLISLLSILSDLYNYNESLHVNQLIEKLMIRFKTDSSNNILTAIILLSKNTDAKTVFNYLINLHLITNITTYVEYAQGENVEKQPDLENLAMRSLALLIRLSIVCQTDEETDKKIHDKLENLFNHKDNLSEEIAKKMEVAIYCYCK